MAEVGTAADGAVAVGAVAVGAASALASEPACFSLLLSALLTTVSSNSGWQELRAEVRVHRASGQSRGD